MPSKVFAKIRLRRGLQADIPSPLMGGEVGWCVDTRRAFIGNGAISEGAVTVGNTELLTEFSPLDEKIQLIYKSNTDIIPQTGTTPSTPTVRTLQERLDDWVSVKDFGAIGDGIADDSAAINRAITQLFIQPLSVGTAAETMRRVLFFPAGRYRVVLQQILFCPYMQLMGEGANSSVIFLDAASPLTRLFGTQDSLGQTGVAIGTNSAVLPINMTISNISLTRNTYGVLGKFDRSSDIVFNGCKFSQLWQTGNTPSRLFDIDKLGAVIDMGGLSFNSCEFTAFYDMFNLADCSNFHDIKFDDCDVHDCYRGVYVKYSSINTTVLGSLFENIEDSGIFGENTSSIKSSSNHFNNVGVTNVVYPIVYSGTAVLCSSVGDTFNNCYTGYYVSGGSLVENTIGNGLFQNVTYTSRNPVITLLDAATNEPTGLSFPTATTNAIFIDYTIVRGTSIRIGRLSIVSDGTSVVINDQKADDSGISNLITFSAIVSSGNIVLRYSSTTSGPTTSALYTEIKRWSHN